jgi:hypothetical protein
MIHFAGSHSADSSSFEALVKDFSYPVYQPKHPVPATARRYRYALVTGTSIQAVDASGTNSFWKRKIEMEMEKGPFILLHRAYGKYWRTRVA